MRKHFLPFASPSIGEEEIAEVVETLRGGWLTTGPRAKRFEEQFAEYVGATFAVAVNSCTAALHLALESIGVGAGDEIITTPMTFAATGEVIRYLGATPVFVDVDPATMNIDSSLISEALSRCRNPRAVLPVHIAGLPSDLDAIIEIARRYDLRVIEDAAHALPTRYKGRMIGSIGDVTCFSFYSTKTLTTGEGGMATTNDAGLADRMRIMSLHGISKDAWKRYTAQGSWYYEILAPGYKYNMPDIMAALGLVQLRRVDEMHKRRTEIARQYSHAFAELGDCLDVPPDADTGGQHAWHLYIIKLRLDRLSIDRDGFIEEMKRHNIGCSVHFIPLHMHPYYRDAYGFKPDDFPHAHAVYKRIVSLPIYPGMTDDDVADVVGAVADICRRHAK
ncbi:MAG: UDP-4-amino-4,6-dideoxy-N-acetyl-beta-L-altrosami ne transaminase [Candidatus Zixiibacteriota bacterium]